MIKLLKFDIFSFKKNYLVQFDRTNSTEYVHQFLFAVSDKMAKKN